MSIILFLLNNQMCKETISLMHLLPIEIVNIICEYAVTEKDIWRIWFCPYTYKLQRKFNKYCQKYIDKSNIIIRDKFTNPMFQGNIRLCNDTNFNIYITNYTATFLQIYGSKFPSCELYIQFDSETDLDKKDKFIYRAMVSFDLYDDGGVIMLPLRNTLYLNGTPYGFIIECLFDRTNDMVMRIELF